MGSWRLKYIRKVHFEINRYVCFSMNCTWDQMVLGNLQNFNTSKMHRKQLCFQTWITLSLEMKIFKNTVQSGYFNRKWWGSEINDNKVARNFRTQCWQKEGRQAESWTSTLEQLVTIYNQVFFHGLQGGMRWMWTSEVEQIWRREILTINTYQKFGK